MTIRTVLAAAALALAAFPPQVARADWAYTHWGMTPEQVVAASKGAVKLLPPAERTREDADHWEISVEGSSTDGPLRLRTGFMFDTRTNGLRCVLYNAMGDDAKTLRSILETRYGKPVSASQFDTVETLKWTTPDEIEFGGGQKPVAAAVTHCAPGSS